MLQLHFKLHGKEVKFLDDPKYTTIQNTLDNLMKGLAKKGIGTHKRKAQVITETEEEILWDMGILGTDTLKL